MELDYSDGIPKIKITPSMRSEMNAIYAQKFSQSNRLNGHTDCLKTDSRKAGILGEIVFKALYPVAIISTVYDYDFIYQGKRVDVKCKLRSAPPNWGQEASVYAYQLRKNSTDVYYFMSTTPQFEWVWICGYIERNELMLNPKSRLWKAGEFDKSNGKVFSQDTLSISYRNLKVPKLDGVDVNICEITNK